MWIGSAECDRVQLSMDTAFDICYGCFTILLSFTNFIRWFGVFRFMCQNPVVEGFWFHFFVVYILSNTPNLSSSFFSVTNPSLYGSVSFLQMSKCVVLKMPALVSSVLLSLFIVFRFYNIFSQHNAGNP